MSSPNPRDDEALDALITASLHLTDHEVSAEEVQAFLASETPLAADKRKAFEEWRPNLRDLRISDEVPPSSTQIPPVASELYVAMNRKNAEDSHVVETEEELERRRHDALKRMKERKSKPEDT
jgi:hypothetical protein